MQLREDDRDRVHVMEAVLLNHFSAALSQNSPGVVLQTEENIYHVLQEEDFGENDFRHIYYQMIYQMELQEGYISNEEASARRIYLEVRDLDTLEKLHGEFVRRVRQTGFVRKNDYSEAVTNTIRHIENELDNENLSIQLLARYVYLTPNYLAAVFKKETGFTIGQYCLRQRMERARQLLTDTRLKLNQIARMVGYRDPEYFSKIFKRDTGCAPSVYREQRTENRPDFFIL